MADERKNELMSSASPITTPSARPARAGALGGPRAMTRAVAHAENAAWTPSRERYPLVSTALTFFNGDFLGWKLAVSPVHVGLFADFQVVEMRKTRHGTPRREGSGYVAARVISGSWTSWAGKTSERAPESCSRDAVGGGFRWFSAQQNRKKFV